MRFFASTTPPTTPVSIAENGGVATLTLTLDRAIPMGDSVLIFPYTITGTGISANDITADSLTGSITVAAGSATGTLTITAVDNGMMEGDKTMTITLGALPSGITAATSIGPVEIIIIDDDATPTQVTSFAITSGSSPIAENGGSVTITLTLNSSIPSGEGALNFPYTIADSTTPVNTANANGIVAADISGSLSGAISVAEGSSTGTLTITAMDDDVDEGASETMTVTLGTLPNNADSTAIARANGVSNSFDITITDDDTTPPTQITGFAITSGSSPIAEDGSDSVTITITLNENVTAASGLDIPYAITGIAFTDITVGSANLADANALSGTITVAMGSDAGDLVIAGRQDTDNEGASETLTVTLGTLPNNNAGTQLTDASGVTNIMITITDDDLFGVSSFTASPTSATFPLPILFSITRATDRMEMTLAVTLNGNATTNLSFPVRLTGGAGREICGFNTRNQAMNCSGLGGTISNLFAIEVSSGASVGTGTYFLGVSNAGNNNGHLPTEGTFTITLPSGVVSGGNDLSEGVSICVHADGDTSNKINGDGSGGCTANS